MIEKDAQNKAAARRLCKEFAKQQSHIVDQGYKLLSSGRWLDEDEADLVQAHAEAVLFGLDVGFIRFFLVAVDFIDDTEVVPCLYAFGLESEGPGEHTKALLVLAVRVVEHPETDPHSWFVGLAVDSFIVC